MDSHYQLGLSPAGRTVIVIPTYNEAENLPALVGELLALAVPGLAILVVDDNSPDGTGKIADALAMHTNGAVQVHHRSKKEGLGRAYVDGISRALEMGADFVIQMDADFSHPPSAVPCMVEEIQHCDVVIGSRYVSGGQLDDRWGWWRRLLSWWANEVWSRRLLGLKQQDITAGFRCWRRSTLLGIGLDRIECDGYAFQVEMTYLTERLGYTVKEIPILFEERRIGKSKMSVRVKLQGAVDVFRIWWLHRSDRRRPLPAHN